MHIVFNKTLAGGADEALAVAERAARIARDGAEKLRRILAGEGVDYTWLYKRLKETGCAMPE